MRRQRLAHLIQLQRAQVEPSASFELSAMPLAVTKHPFAKVSIPSIHPSSDKCPPIVTPHHTETRTAHTAQTANFPTLLTTTSVEMSPG